MKKIGIRIGLLALSLGLLAQVQAQTAHSWLRRGDQSYTVKQYTEAENGYRKSLEKKSGPQGEYNLANALYQQKRYEEAISHYRNALKNAKENYQKSQTFHNLGNAYFQNNKIDESITAYKNALRINPKDQETKINLALALKRKQQQEQQKQQQKDQGKDQNKDQNQEQQQQNQQNQNQPQPQQNQQQNQQQQNPNQPQNQQKQPQGRPQNLSRKEAENLLDIMEQEERKVQSKLKRVRGQARNEKDW
jgi:Ca-activated chloride channel homolog